MAKKIDIPAEPHVKGASYPPPFHEPCAGRQRWRLGDLAGLSQFGINLLRLAPGAWSSQRHWHTAEDEFVYVLEGEAILVTDDGEEVLRAGDCAGFKADDSNGHHLQNRTDREVVLLEVGSRRPGEGGVDYPDIDMEFPKGAKGFQHRDGRPYPR